jgi:hypothetical protein
LWRLVPLPPKELEVLLFCTIPDGHSSTDDPFCW